LQLWWWSSCVWLSIRLRLILLKSGGRGELHFNGEELCTRSALHELREALL